MDLANECKDVISEFFTLVELDALVVCQRDGSDQALYSRTLIH